MTFRMRAGWALICVLAASGAGAQDRPDPAPRDGIRKADVTRPPDRPDADEDLPPAAAEAQTIGPPLPPPWFALRESDAEYDACLLALSVLGTRYAVEPAVTDPDNRDCGIARPVRVTQIIPGVELQGAALMRCDTARALGLWAHQFLRPAAAALPDAPRLTGLQLGTTYDCRARIGTGEAAPKLSEHAAGIAIDIAAFLFDKGDPIPVTPREDSGDLAEAFQRAARGSACLFFTTVLGPGSNAAHDDHLHLDTVQRKGGWRLCQ